MTALTAPETTPTEGQAVAPQAPAAPAQAASAPEQKAPQNAPQPVAAEQKPVSDKPQGAPEKYEFKTHEGFEFDSQVLEVFGNVAKELNLTQDSAQKVLDTMAPKLQERQNQQLQTIRNEWVQNTRADAEFGGEKLDANLSVARKALDAFGTKELRSLLNDSGLGDHPEVIRFMYRAGKAISEDRFVAGSQGGKVAAPQTFNDLANVLYSKKA
jgi:hypothetical protein